MPASLYFTEMPLGYYSFRLAFSGIRRNKLAEKQAG
jgi:hypothetical protein